MGVQENFAPQVDGWVPRSSEVMLRSGRVRTVGTAVILDFYWLIFAPKKGVLPKFNKVGGHYFIKFSQHYVGCNSV